MCFTPIPHGFGQSRTDLYRIRRESSLAHAPARPSDNNEEPGGDDHLQTRLLRNTDKYLATVVKTAETQRPSAIGEFKSVVLQSRKADRGGDGEGGGEVEEGDDGNGGRDDGPKDEPGGTSPTGQGV